MPNIIDQIRDAYTGNPAKALKLIPELIKQHEDGLIKVLQCKVGDTVYLNHSYWGNLCKGFVYQITNTTHWDVCISAESTLIGIEFHVTQKITDFGKTVFLTYESAEAALKERETNGN